MSSGRTRLALGAGGLALIAYFYRQQQAAKRAARRRARDAAAGGGKKKRRKNPMLEIFWRLWPFGKSAKELRDDPDATVGRIELAAILLVSVLRTWHQNRMVYIKTALMEATYNRDGASFRRIMVETVGLSVVSSLIFSVHRYLKERLTLLWREKLTRQLHRRYFHAMSYYKLSHLNKSKIKDVEERITRDPRRFCKSLADEMEKLSAAATSGVWFTYKLYTISTVPFAISPLMYFYVAFRASMAIAPDWSKRWRGMLDRRGEYFKTQSRLQAHSEAICAYQGNEQERAIIEGYWEKFLGYCVHFVKDASLFHFVSQFFFDYGSHSFAEALIVGSFISPASSPAKAQYVEQAAKIGAEVAQASGQGAAALKEASAAMVKANATLFAEVRFLTEYFIRAMSAQGTIIAVLRQLQAMRGPAKRITELYSTLGDFEEKREASTTFRDSKDTIAFDDVQVYTPTGHLLVKDLKFSITKGTNMLLTGCNGSGKSSIFRCLGALWKVPEGGVITKPGGNEAGLNSNVFYLPQKPYNVLGTLRDQLCYPEDHTRAQTITREELASLLDEVDLGYLMERKDGVDNDTEVNWETTLSLGEQQRLAMARLFYHKPEFTHYVKLPQFAILDECTSGVSASMERRLYETCAARGVTCITISHRPVLEQYHDVVLNITADKHPDGKRKGGWTWRETGRKSKGASAIRAETETGEKGVGGFSAAYLADSATSGEQERKFLEDRCKKYRAEAGEEGSVVAELIKGAKDDKI